MGVDQIDCCRRPVTNEGKNFNNKVNNPLFKEAFGDDDFDDDNAQFEPDDKFRTPSAFPPKQQNNNHSRQNNFTKNNLRTNKFGARVENQLLDPFASDNFNPVPNKRAQSFNKNNLYSNISQNSFPNYPKMPNMPYMNTQTQSTTQNQYLNNVQKTNQYNSQLQYAQQPKIQTSTVQYAQPKVQYPIQNLTNTYPNFPTTSAVQYKKIQTLPQNVITPTVPTVQYAPQKQNMRVIPQTNITSPTINYAKQPKIQSYQMTQITQPQTAKTTYNNVQYYEPAIQNITQTAVPKTTIVSSNINYLEPQTQTTTIPQATLTSNNVNYLEPQTQTTAIPQTTITSNNVTYLEPQIQTIVAPPQTITTTTNTYNYLEQPQTQSVQISSVETTQPVETSNVMSYYESVEPQNVNILPVQYAETQIQSLQTIPQTITKTSNIQYVEPQIQTMDPIIETTQQYIESPHIQTMEIPQTNTSNIQYIEPSQQTQSTETTTISNIQYTEPQIQSIQIPQTTTTSNIQYAEYTEPQTQNIKTTIRPSAPSSTINYLKPIIQQVQLPPQIYEPQIQEMPSDINNQYIEPKAPSMQFEQQQNNNYYEEQDQVVNFEKKQMKLPKKLQNEAKKFLERPSDFDDNEENEEDDGGNDFMESKFPRSNPRLFNKSARIKKNGPTRKMPRVYGVSDKNSFTDKLMDAFNMCRCVPKDKSINL